MDSLNRKQFNKELVSLAIPLALQNLLNALVGASDALMLGRLTQEAIAAVSLANQITFILSLFNASLVGGGGTLGGAFSAVRFKRIARLKCASGTAQPLVSMRASA